MNVDPNTPRFFIALVPPQSIQDYAAEVIQELSDRYRTRTSKAPPHVTLQPPFQWPIDQITVLEQCLATVANQHSPVSITLSGFGAFAPRVLYVNVLKTPELLTLQSDLAETLENTLNIADPTSKQRPFAPHLTVASRNLTRQTFKQAWSDLQTRSVEVEFVIDRLTLLIHRGDRWQIKGDWVLDLGR